MRWYFAIPLGTRLVCAFVAGAGAGLLLGERAAVLAPASRLLIELLRVLAPVVVGVFVLSALSAGGLRGLGRIAVRAIAACVLMAALAAAIGAFTVRSMRPDVPIGPSGTAAGPPVQWLATVTRWLPGQGAGPEKAVPLVFAITVPAALAIGGWRSARPSGPADMLHRGLATSAAAVTRALSWVLEYAPIGTFAAAALLFSEAGRAAGMQLAFAVIAVYTAHGVLFAAMLATGWTLGLRPGSVIARSREALVTAVATGSSAATLPLELRIAETALRLPPAAARTVMPLGTTLCKVGTTAFLGALGVVAGLGAGATLTLPWLAQLVAWCTVAGLATPPISGGGFVMLALVFGQMGVPLAWVPVLTSLPLIGKLNTPLNALGRLLLAAALARRAQAPN